MINYIIDKNRFSIAFYSQKYLKISNARISIANDQCYSYTNPIDSYQNLHHRISSERHKRGCTRFRVRSGRALNIQPLSIPAHPFLPEPIFALSVSSLSSLSFHPYRARVLKHALQRRREGLNSPFRYYPVMWEYNVSRFKGKNSDHLRHPSVVAIPLFVPRIAETGGKSVKGCTAYRGREPG